MFHGILKVGILLLSLLAVFPDESSASMKLVCYFNTDSYDGKFTPEDIDPTSCTHINYGFAALNEETSQIDFGNKTLDVDENLYGRVVALKGKNPDLKTILCIGGWNDSTRKYSDLVADPFRRAHFVKTVVPFLQTYGFDGLDVAWEYPNCWKGACGINPDDVENYVAFLSNLRSAFQPVSLLLTASVSANIDEIDEAYNIPGISKLLDHINLMSYDWHGGWEKTTGHHAQFYTHPDDIKPQMNLNSAVNHWIYRGVDKSKLIVGIPTYGRSFTLVDPNKHGLNAPALGPGKADSKSNDRGLYAFNEICKDLDSWSHFEDEKVGSYSVRGDQWVGYDTPKVATSKARFALHRGLGGAAYKSFYTDDHTGSCFGDPFPILKSIRYGLTSNEEKDFEKNEKDMRVFVQKLQLSILVDAERSQVTSAEKDTGMGEDKVYITLTETETTDSGEEEVKTLEVNAATLVATGDVNGRTLGRMGAALLDS